LELLYNSQLYHSQNSALRQTCNSGSRNVGCGGIVLRQPLMSFLKIFFRGCLEASFCNQAFPSARGYRSPAGFILTVSYTHKCIISVDMIKERSLHSIGRRIWHLWRHVLD